MTAQQGGTAPAVGRDDLGRDRDDRQVSAGVRVARDREGKRRAPAEATEVTGQGELDQVLGDRVDKADVELVADAEQLVQRAEGRAALLRGDARPVGDVDA